MIAVAVNCAGRIMSVIETTQSTIVSAVNRIGKCLLPVMNGLVSGRQPCPLRRYLVYSMKATKYWAF